MQTSCQLLFPSCGKYVTSEVCQSFCDWRQALPISQDSFCDMVSSVDVLQIMQTLKTHLLRTQRAKVLPFTAWIGSKYSHACFTYSQGFLPRPTFYLPGLFTFIFSKTSS